MTADIKASALFSHMAELDGAYASKLLELRDVLESWLAYTPQTFPHYTLHTVTHSDEVIRQVSSLLFDEQGAPTVGLSATELYVVGAAAYLHDAGMVSSDAEKTAILESLEWQEWVGEGGPGNRRMEAIRALRDDLGVPDETVRNFLADLQLRRLLAEFIRQSHAARGARLAVEQQEAFGRFAFGDPLLRDTISTVCLGHGLSRRELDDTYSFPFRRDIRGDKVNVRFAAIVLRLADLLDMSAERACPLLMNASGRLPADSAAHWKQYQRITHRMTSPDVIEVRAECETQDEHRVLRDWLRWLADETEGARRLMAGSPRHGSWEPPRANLQGDRGTLQVLRAPGATYLESDWRFELDADAVFERLILDIYEEPLAFVRELLQNSLDATRCRVYEETQQVHPPTTPTALPEDERERYPVAVRLWERERTNPLSGEPQMQQVLTVSDRGTGMDMETISGYLLQIGRSFYTSPEFRRRYVFTPTSRFGVGFLSTLAVSDEIVVETKTSEGVGIRLTLTGPRDYLLTQVIEKVTTGTDVHVALRQPIDLEELHEALSSWCRRVEFPIEVDLVGSIDRLTAETNADFEYRDRDVSAPGGYFGVRSIPMRVEGIEGELYVFHRISAAGEEDWAVEGWREQYSSDHPFARHPRFLRSLTCLNGLAILHPPQFWADGLATRIDVRRPIRASLSRGTLDFESVDVEIYAAWEEALEDHLAQRSSLDWRYRSDMAASFAFLEDYWVTAPSTVPCIGADGVFEISIADARSHTFIVLVSNEQLDEPGFSAAPESVVILIDDFARLSDAITEPLMKHRHLHDVERTSDGTFSMFVWGRGKPTNILEHPGSRTIYQFDFDEPSVVGFLTPLGWMHGGVILNTSHPIVEWLLRLHGHFSSTGWTAEHVGQWAILSGGLMEGLEDPRSWDDFVYRVEAWVSAARPPDELQPPPVPAEEDIWDALELVPYAVGDAYGESL